MPTKAELIERVERKDLAQILKDAYESEQSIRGIARKLGVAVGTVQKWLAQEDLVIAPSRLAHSSEVRHETEQ